MVGAVRGHRDRRRAHGHRDGGRARGHRGGTEALGRHLHDEGVQAVASNIAGPDEIATGDVEIPLGKLRVVVTTTAGVEIGHDRRDHEDAPEPSRGKQRISLAPGPLDPVSATAAGVLVCGLNVGPRIAVGHVVDLAAPSLRSGTRGPPPHQPPSRVRGPTRELRPADLPQL